MLHLRSLLVTLSVCLSLAAPAQKVYRLTVADSTSGQPVEYAAVVLVDTISGKMEFNHTDVEGRVTVPFPASNGFYRLRVNALGYRGVNRTVGRRPFPSNTRILLHPLENRLAEIVVRDTLPPVTYRPDTVTYNARAFYTGKERKLKDLVAKLPGLSIDEDLNVSYRGQAVNVLLVEGKPFFGGEGELALKGLPADAIGRIQLLEDYKPLGFTTDPAERKKLALNVLIKEEKRNVYFGEIGAGGGAPGRYHSQLDGFRFNRRTNNYLFAGGNNVREEMLSFRSIMRLIGGGFDGSDDGFQTVTDINDRLLPPRFSADGSQQLLAVGTDHNFSPQTTISAYGLLPRTHNLGITASSAAFQFTDLRETSSSRQREASLVGLGRFNLTTKIDLNTVFQLRGQYTHDEHDSRVAEELKSNRSQDVIAAQQDEQTSDQMRLDSRFTHRTKAGHLLRIDAQAVYAQTSQLLALESSVPILVDVLAGDEYRFDQQVQREKNQFVFGLRYHHRLSRRLLLDLGASTEAVRYQLDIDSPLRSARRPFNRWQPRVAAGLLLKTDRLSASARLGLVRPTAKLARVASPSVTYLQPIIETTWQPGAANRLRFSWTTEPERPAIRWLEPGPRVLTFQSYRIPLDQVPLRNAHSATLSYRYHNPIRGRGYRLSSNYTSQARPGVVTAVDLTGIDRRLRFLLVDRPVRNLNTQLRYWWETRSGKGELTLSDRRRQQLIATDSLTLTNTLPTQQLSFSLRSSPNDFYDFRWRVAGTRSTFPAGNRPAVINLSASAFGTYHRGRWWAESSLEGQVFDLAKTVTIRGWWRGELRYTLSDSPWQLTAHTSLPLGGRDYRTFTQTDGFFSDRRIEQFAAFIVLGAALQL